MSGRDAYQLFATNVREKKPRFPSEPENRSFEGALFLPVKPKFLLEQGTMVFTIGSCFARPMERGLRGYGTDVPVLYFLLHPGK